MIIDKPAYWALIEHMQQAAPREGVGLLAGPLNRPTPPGGQWQGPSGAIVDRWVPLENVSEFPGARFEVDPQALINAWENLDAEGRRPWVVVHSHVRTSAAPSPTDVRYAVDPSMLHMIVSLAASRPVAALWRIDPNAHPVDQVKKVHYTIADLAFRTVGTTDLTHGVTEPTV